MKDYARIATKIAESIWLITPEGLDVVLNIAHKRLNGGQFDSEDLSIVNNLRGGSGRYGADDDTPYQIVKGVGVLPIMGPIFGKANLMTQMSGATSLETTRNDFRMMMNDDSVQSILLEIDSPGGTSDLVQEFGDEIYEAGDTKPIYAIADTNAGSAAFWLMSQARDGIYATPSGAVGSIGAYTVHQDQSGADAQQGHKYSFISAGQHKTEGNPHEPLSHEARAYRQEVIDEVYGDFIHAVARGRGVDTTAVESFYGQGRMLTAKKALDGGMIDGIVPKDALIKQLANNQTKPQVVTANFQVQERNMAGKPVPGKVRTFTSTALLVDDTAYWLYAGTGTTNELNEYGVLLESKEWEHSQSGAGSPPPPRQGPGSEDGSDSPDIISGSRQSPLPLDINDPGAPKPSPRPPNSNVSDIEGSEMNEEQLARYRAMLSLPDTADEVQVFSAIEALVSEQNALRSAVTATSEETRLSEQYPQFWAQHQQMLSRDRQNNADAFVHSIQQFSRPEGDKFVPSKIGLSALAMETVTETHLKFAQGEGSLLDFENAIRAVAQGGTVDYGEHGSSQTPESMVIDTSTAAGIQNARKLFAEKVASVQADDKELTYMEAVSLAAEKYPDLAAAYRQAAVIR